MAIIEDLRGQVDLSEHGIDAGGTVHHNPTVALLYSHALKRGDGTLGRGGLGLHHDPAGRAATDGLEPEHQVRPEVVDATEAVGVLRRPVGACG